MGVFFKRGRDSIWKDALLGAIAGGVATALMTPAMERFQKWERPKAKAKEKALSDGEWTTEKVARKAAGIVGVQLDDTQRKVGAQVVDFGYGIFWGAVFGALHDRVRLPHLAHGLLFGTLVGALGEAVLLPAFKLAPPVTKYEVDTHLAGLAGHLVYGASAAGSLDLMKRVLA